MRKLTNDEVTFIVSMEPEYVEVRGNTLACGDDAEDKAAEDEIIYRLSGGDYSAWCSVTVEAEWNDHKSSASFGCVTLPVTSSGQECQNVLEEFARSEGLYDLAVVNLNDSLAEFVELGKRIEQLLK